MIYTRIEDKNVGPERVILSTRVDNNITLLYPPVARSGQFFPRELRCVWGEGEGGAATKHEMNDGRFHALAGGLSRPSIINRTHISNTFVCLYIILLWWLLWANFFNCRLGLVRRSSSRYGKSASIGRMYRMLVKIIKLIYTWKNVHLVGCLWNNKYARYRMTRSFYPSSQRARDTGWRLYEIAAGILLSVF